MADFVYNNARYLFATGALNWKTAALNAALVTAAYGPLPTHVNLSDVTGGAMLVRDLVLTGKDVTPQGIVFGVIPTVHAFLNVTPVIAVLFYVKGSDDAHSPLVYYSGGGFGFPFLPQGFDYTIAFDQVNGGFFQV